MNTRNQITKFANRKRLVLNPSDTRLGLTTAIKRLEPNNALGSVNLYRLVTNLIYDALFVFEGTSKKTKRSFLNKRQLNMVAYYEKQLVAVINEAPRAKSDSSQIVSNLKFFMFIATLNIQIKEAIKLS